MIFSAFCLCVPLRFMYLLPISSGPWHTLKISKGGTEVILHWQPIITQLHCTSLIYQLLFTPSSGWETAQKSRPSYLSPHAFIHLLFFIHWTYFWWATTGHLVLFLSARKRARNEARSLFLWHLHYSDRDKWG